MRKILTVALLVFIHLRPAAQTPAEKADALMTAYAQQYKFNGSVLVAQHGKVILEKGYGFKDAKDGTLNDANTIYQIGSITKQFTATVILKLQEQQKLNVKDKLSKYFPGYAKGDSITIENLLTHTSGIYNYTNDGRFMNNSATKPSTQEKMLALFKDKPLDFSPGTRWSYSNSGYTLLGYIIEKVAGLPYEKAVRNYIFQPLGMTHSGFDFTHLTSSDKATGYFVYIEKSKLPANLVDSSVSYAAGAIYTTVGDLYKWHKGLLTSKIIGQASLQKAYTPFKNNYGYGWGIDSLFGKRIIAHGGGIFGFNTNIARITEDDVCIVLLNNAGNPLLQEITNKLLAILYNKPYEVPKAKKEITVPQTVLQQYVGEYEMAKAVVVKFFIDNGVFKTQITGQPAFELYAEAEDKFFLKVVEASIVFFKNSDGKYDKCILYQNGAERVCTRIK
jgi:CubicO group peptidase (beta-lactamase class C family)